MKKVLAWLLVLALTAAISIGATLAYLTDTDEDVNVMTLGKVKIDQLEYERVNDETANENAEVQEFHDNKPLYPAVTENGFDYTPGNTVVDWEQIGKDGYTSEIWNPEKINNELDKMVFVKNKGTYDAYVRTVFAFEAGNYGTLDEFQTMMHLNLNDTDWTWEWGQMPVDIGESTYFVAVATYNKTLEPGAFTEISLSQIALDKTATNADVEAFGDTYQILVKTQAIQADGFDTAAAALNEGFGAVVANLGTEDAPIFEVNADALPFVDDSPIEGVELKNALHYLNGDVTGTKITDKVTSVTFGLNKDNADIVNNYTGILMDVGQDVPVHVYYVPNGANYDVYFLANDDIYAPESCYELFYNGVAMSALKSLDLSNLNTSRTTIMSRMFRNLPLKEIDVSGFDTSSVTAMDYVFYNCTALQSLDLSGWNMDNVTITQAMFYQCKALTTIGDVENWDLSNVELSQHMFYFCHALKELTGTQNWGLENTTNMMSMFHTCTSLTDIEGIEQWNLGKVENASYTFYSANKLKELDLNNWDMSNATTTFAMFYGAAGLETLNVADWDVSNVTNMAGTFSDCTNLTSLDVSKWDTGKVTEMYLMFARCPKLTEINLDQWDTSSVTTMRLMFDGDYALTTVHASGWDTSSVTEFKAMFQGCYSLKNIDVSGWDTGNVVDMQHMFAGCTALEELDVSAWNVSKVKHFNAMFQGGSSNGADMKLKALDVSNWQPTSAVYMNHMFYGCAQFTEIDMSDWNMPNLYSTSHMFADCHKLKTIDMTNWNTPSLYSMDAMFNDCRSVEFMDVSDIDTQNVKEFSQLFESCYSLKEIKGLENWDTTKVCCFYEMFLNCSSLKELNLSSFSTKTVNETNKHLNGDASQGFKSAFAGMTSLEKLVLSENFDFDGNGSIKNKATLPNPPAKAGYTAKWRNVETGEIFAASEIPDGVAATYEAYYEPVTTN